ncbi:universal stress protein [Gloeocapsopsis dulcis]|uniref:Universal stress protein n=1 Tax=Gloeocapsopsis dulcis AAB1 = 1H9 TaxID=1433147 RepID=A0A6N8G1U0_9CHRO|nr:universal stress protein [Gloeocapsopsis dulcis]MUL39303.1 universal stress protein UspA [Gloeocapsopsis dulcis AAB1 = 1H9]WNN87938.1 universal stress protein [Gloeocapsopsis dulcis]
MTWLQKNRVLVPIDFSEESFAALNPAREFVQDSSQLYVLHVLSHLHPAEPGVVWNTIDDETRKKHAQEALYERLKNSEYQGAHLGILVGDPSSKIIDYAQEINADLIVIPSHGRTGLSRFFLGSVAERVIRFAHCPVVVLRK